MRLKKVLKLELFCLCDVRDETEERVEHGTYYTAEHKNCIRFA